MPRRPNYTKEALNEALKKIHDKKMSLRSVAKKYNIPRTTLQFKLKNPSTKSEFGPKPYLTKEEENCIKDWLIKMVCKGSSIRSNDVLDVVQNFLIKHPRDTPFVNNRPGIGWLKAFFKRHPTLSQSISEGVTGDSTFNPLGEEDSKVPIDISINLKGESETEESMICEDISCIKSEKNKSSFISFKDNTDEDHCLNNDFDISKMNVESEEKLMSFKDFKNIIGEDALSKIHTLQCLGREINERTPILYKLWNFFQKSNNNDFNKKINNIQIKTPNNRTKNVNLVNDENMTTDKITMTPSNNICIPHNSTEKLNSGEVEYEYLRRRKRRNFTEKKRQASHRIKQNINKNPNVKACV